MSDPSIVRMAYEHDPDRGTTRYRVWVLASGETFEREVPTPVFLSMMEQAEKICRKREVRL